jgi:CheY-like chemotaxis protein
MPRVIAVVDDLMSLSRIREAGRGAGAEVLSARGPGDLVEAALDGGRLVLVDADSSRLPWEDALRALRAEPALAGLPVVAFVSHVHAGRVEAARAAGATRVLARSAFVQELPRLLADAADPPAATRESDG